MSELGPDQDVINCAAGDSLIGATLTVLIKPTWAKYGVSLSIHKLQYRKGGHEYTRRKT